FARDKGAAAAECRVGAHREPPPGGRAQGPCRHFPVAAGAATSISIGPDPREDTMDEILRTNDVVLISFVETLLKEAGIRYFVADQNMSVIEGSLGILPRRVLVPADDVERTRRLLREAGVGDELEKPKKKT